MIFPVMVSVTVTSYFDAPGKLSHVHAESLSAHTSGVGVGAVHVSLSLLA